MRRVVVASGLLLIVLTGWLFLFGQGDQAVPLEQVARDFFHEAGLEQLRSYEAAGYVADNDPRLMSTERAYVQKARRHFPDDPFAVRYRLEKLSSGYRVSVVWVPRDSEGFLVPGTGRVSTVLISSLDSED